MYEVFAANKPSPLPQRRANLDDVASEISDNSKNGEKRLVSFSKKSKNVSETTDQIRIRADSEIPSSIGNDEVAVTQHAFSPGKMVWLQMQDHSLAGAAGVANWKRATISSRYGDTLTLIMEIDPRKKRHSGIAQASKYKVIDISCCFPANSSIQPDLTSLAHIHEPAILYNVKMRALWRQPYTFIGEVLISVNPLQEVGEDGLDFLRDPHPKTVAERALRRLRFGIKETQRRELADLRKLKTESKNNSKGAKGRSVSGISAVKSAFSNLTKTLRGTNKKLKGKMDRKSNNREKAKTEVKSLVEQLKVNQAVIISGESGSGKTEAARRVLSQLVDGFEVEDDEDGLQDRILASEPLLESFGNARTSKNPNSSRFGKFLKIYYTIDEEDYVELRAAGISTYLLEISRVVRQSDRERNFRIFYNVLSTPVIKFQTNLGLKEANYVFSYINGEYHREQQDEIQYFELAEAFKNSKLGISWSNLLEFVGGILHMGNIVFSTKTTNAGDIAEIKPTIIGDKEYDALKWAAHCFGIEAGPLQDIILQKVVRVGREEVMTTRNPALAKEVTDSIAKKVYTMAFEWMIVKMNGSLIESDYSYKQLPFTNYVGILDVFGFEVFERNGLEQLLINYANEVLQLVFTEQVLVAESELFRKEGIIVDDSIMPRTALTEQHGKIRLDFFSSVFTTLDNTMRLPRATDERFAKELMKSLKNSPLFVPPHRKDFGRKFIIKHFASKVEYTVGEFLIKNNDALPEISHLFTFSTNPMLQQLNLGDKPKNFANELQREQSIGHSSNGSRKRGRRRRKKSIFRASGNLGKASKHSSNNLFASTRTMGKTAKRRSTVSSTFKKQIKFLSDSLKDCGCSYIRCVKPNPFMTPPKGAVGRYQGENVAELYNFYGLEKAEMVLKARSFYKTGSHIKRRIGNQITQGKEDGYFDADYVTRQLHFLGVFDAVKVLKSGLPTRINYSTFMSTFQSSIPLESSPYLRNLPDDSSLRYRYYIAALMYAFRVPESSYRLGLTKVFFKFGQIDNISLILSSTSKWGRPRLETSFNDESLITTQEEELGQQEVTKAFYFRLMRMRWRSAFIKVRVFLVFKAMMQKNNAARTIQQAVRKYFERKETMYRLKLDKRALQLQRVWRGYVARKEARKLREEKEKQRLLEERKREAIRQKYLAKREKETVEAFAKVQNRHRRQLTMEKIKLKRKQERIFAAMEAIRQQKQLEMEAKQAQEERARELQEKLIVEKETKELRRKRLNEKQQSLQLLQQKVEIKVADLENGKRKVKEQMKDRDFRRATLRREKKEKLDIKSGVAEIERIEKKIEKIEAVEAVLSEVASQATTQVTNSRKSQRRSQKRRWVTKKKGTFHRGTFATRMNIVRNETKKPTFFIAESESSDSDSDSSKASSIIEEEKPAVIEKAESHHSEEGPEYGLDIVSKGVFNTRITLLKEKVKQINHQRSFNNAEQGKRNQSQTYMGAFATAERKKKKKTARKAREKEELAAEIQNFAKILEIELTLEELQTVDLRQHKTKGRKWKERVKPGIRYKNISKPVVERQPLLEDPKVLIKLDGFVTLGSVNFLTKIFRCNNGNPRSSFQNLNAKISVVEAGANVVMKKRRVTLQKYSIAAGELKLWDAKGSKRSCVLKMRIDHKVKYTLDDDEVKKKDKYGNNIPAWQRSKGKSRLFVLHVPTGNTVCFEFKSVLERDNWLAELKRAQIGFFGNEILDHASRVKLTAIDKVIAKKGDVKRAIAGLGNETGANNETTNPKYRKSTNVRDLIKAHENKSKSQVSSWTTTFLNIGKKPKSTRIPKKEGKKSKKNKP